MIPRGNSPTAGLGTRSVGVNDGEFEFDEVLPGNYILQATPDGMSGPTMLVGRQVISVANGDLNGVVVEMKPGIQLSGKVIVEGNPPPMWPNIALLPEEGNNYQSEFPEVNPDGSFIIGGLEPAPYRAVVNGLRPPHFVKSIRFGGHDVTREGFDVVSSPWTTMCDIR